MMRSQIDIQEAALAAIVRCGDAQPVTVRYEVVESDGSIKTEEKLLYKITEEQRYDLRTKPREKPIVRQCCLTCRYKKLVTGSANGEAEPIRKCIRTGEEVMRYRSCGLYEMKEWMKRL